MFDNHRNLSIGTIHLAPIPSTSGTSLTLVTGQGAFFQPNNPCTLIPAGLQPTPANAEIGYITDVTGDALTITRAQEGSTARSVDAGWVVIAGPTAKTFMDIESVLTTLKTKLDGIATGATQNASDADLRDRTTHTGSQAISTVTGLQTALDTKAATTYVDAGDTASRARSNHTGTQTSSTISDFTSAVSSAAPVQSVAGKTGTVTVTKGDVGLGNADNTSDLLKPVSTAQAAADALKEDLTNKSTTNTLGTSDMLYPTQNAVKSYVDTQNGNYVLKAGDTTGPMTIVPTVGDSLTLNGTGINNTILRFKDDGSETGAIFTLNGTNDLNVRSSAQLILTANNSTTPKNIRFDGSNFYASAGVSLGISSQYFPNTYTQRLYLNSTAYLDGATAGTANLTGNLVMPGTSSGISGTATSDILRLSGGTLSDGATILLGGSTNGAIASEGQIRINTTALIRWTAAGVSVGNQATLPTHALTLGSTANGYTDYNTVDQTTNYERVRKYWSGNVYNIAAEQGGTGGSRNIFIGAVTSGTTYSTGGNAKISHNTATTGVIGTSLIANTGTLNASSGTQLFTGITPTISQSSTAGRTIFLINETVTTDGSGAKLLIDAQSGGVSKFSVSSSGYLSSTSSSNSSNVQFHLSPDRPLVIEGTHALQLRPFVNNLGVGDSQLSFAASGATKWSAGYVGQAGSLQGSYVIADSYDLPSSPRLIVTTSGRVGFGQFPTAVIDIKAGSTTGAQLRFRTSGAPTTPNDGDIWYDGTNLKMQIGGTTKTFTLV